MIFNQTPLIGAHLIELESRKDHRGYFARAFCASEFHDNGLESNFVQANISYNKKAGTIRGMHLQKGRDSEVKLVRCVQGLIYDVIVDLRLDSPTYLRWYGAELSDNNGLAMYVPRGFAHGYQAISDGALVHYMVSAFYAPESEYGVRYDDPSICIRWPLLATEVSEKDAMLPLIEAYE